MFEPEQPRNSPSRDNLLKRKTVLRKTNLMFGGPLANSEYVLESSYASKKEACVFYPKFPRALLSTGFIIVPSLSSANIKGKYELEVYCSEKFELHSIPESESKVIAGSWTEAISGGSHIHSSWKKNPMFTLRLKNTSRSIIRESGEEIYYKVRISLTRHGSVWRAKERKDTVGCMIAFYVFISSGNSNDLVEIYASPFVPTSEVCSEDDFQLQPLKKGEEYVIMPATNQPGIIGNFVLSVMCAQEFLFTSMKEKKTSTKSKQQNV